MFDHLDARAISIGDHPAKFYLGVGPLALEVLTVTLAERPGFDGVRCWSLLARGG